MEKGSEEEEEEDSRKRQVENEIAQEVVAGIKKLASAPEDAKPTSQRAVEQNMRQNWDCSQTEDSDEEEIMEWHKEDQLKKQGEEDEKKERF